MQSNNKARALATFALSGLIAASLEGRSDPRLSNFKQHIPRNLRNKRSKTKTRRKIANKSRKRNR